MNPSLKTLVRVAYATAQRLHNSGDEQASRVMGDMTIAVLEYEAQASALREAMQGTFFEGLDLMKEYSTLGSQYDPGAIQPITGERH